jgi:hypothetical protein
MQQSIQQTPPSSLIIPEVRDNLNRLFVADDRWREPDWKTYDPYTEDKIEAPTVDDFGTLEYPVEQPEATFVEDTPKFMQHYSEPNYPDLTAMRPEQHPEQPEDELPQMPNAKSELPDFESEDEEQQPENSNASNASDQSYLESRRKLAKYPQMDLFVRGSDYESVAIELHKINEMLSTPEPAINITEDIIKNQEADLNRAKDNMEFLFKKLTVMEKRIFKT